MHVLLLSTVGALGSHTHQSNTPQTGQSLGQRDLGDTLALSCACSTNSGVTKSPATGGSQGTISSSSTWDLLSFLRNTATVASAYGKGGPGCSGAVIVLCCARGTVPTRGAPRGSWRCGGDVCVRVRAASWTVLSGKEREEGRSKPHLKIGLKFDGVWSCASCFEQPQGDERCS